MAMSVLKGDTHETVSSPQAPYFPDAELAGAGIQVHQIAMSRIQRIQAAEYVFSLKGLAQRLADRDAALSQHWGKLFLLLSSSKRILCFRSKAHYRIGV